MMVEKEKTKLGKNVTRQSKLEVELDENHFFQASVALRNQLGAIFCSHSSIERPDSVSSERSEIMM